MCVCVSCVYLQLRLFVSNLKVALPIKIFEVSDVCGELPRSRPRLRSHTHTHSSCPAFSFTVLDPSAETSARNVRRMAATFVGLQSGFEFIHGLVCACVFVSVCVFISPSVQVDRVMALLDSEFVLANSDRAKAAEATYKAGKVCVRVFASVFMCVCGIVLTHLLAPHSCGLGRR